MIEPGFSFDGQHSDDFALNCLTVKRTMLPTSTDVFVNIPGRPGAWHFPMEPGDRSVVVTAGVEGVDETDLIQKVSAIAAWLRPLGRKELIFDVDPDWYFSAVVTNPGDIAKSLDLGQWDIEFAAEPYLYALQETSASASLGASATITNAGDIETPARVVIAATGGAGITNPSVTLGGYTFSIVGSIPNGQSLVVDALDQIAFIYPGTTAPLAGAADRSLGTPIEIVGDFPILAPGDNALGTLPNLSGTVKVFWRLRRL